MNEKVKKILESSLSIGVLSKAHGLNGELRFVVFTNILELLEDLDEVFLYNDREKRGFYLEVESIREGPKSFLIKFEEFDTREEAEKLVGFEVYVPRDKLPELAENEYMYDEIEGCEVFEDGEDIGKVVDIIDTGANEVLVVRKDKKEKLVPFIKDYIEEVDLERREIKVRKLEWI
ncbi:MAG: 16S rRNA processing protein RimM [Thermotogaceae bacterium]|nr:16S rRNA processing protein RimM [Thermotogaceae bacterium]